MASYHKSNFGKFGGCLVTDIDGYTYTTAEEWRDVANVDMPTDDRADEEHLREWSEEQARASQAAIDDATAAVDAWRRDN